MARYEVTVRIARTEIIDADNEYMAAVTAAERHGNGVEIADVRAASGRLKPVGGTPAAGATAPKKARRPVSPEARARLAQNLVKARAARAAKAKARKKATTKSTAKRKAG
jgi:hypothetical protein